ncbi:FtsH protease activity modulator HflK [Aliidiomarina maris]|uniref:Protein HflK n=1 Tax=Aliidiomarina maris TaxID=531312 RepID=A0A327X1V8_9GAMM|nr:FtsH protease activity modulator HflK [Aliidiomarina maris]RAJ99198.1 protease FtsH subunit HflK [Aliidiomarina maris]RUO27657.1 FtsH protease activity modulator HflK [Aliidiomarina maris]
MAWNQPGNGGDKNRDPWKNQGGKDQGPPDLDEALKNLLGKLGMGGKGGQGGSGQSGGSVPSKLIGLVAVLALVVWFIAGFYTVNEAERGVVLRFGAYHTEVTSGLHWRPVFIDEVSNVDVNNVQSQQTSGFMLTEDENVVRVELGVQYRVVNARAYLYNVEAPDDSLAQITDSALRFVVGHNTMDNILTVGREQIRQQTWEIIDRLVERYDLGINVIDVNFLPARPPEEVRDAFDDAIAAQEDEERFIREAEAYAREREPQARGRVRRLQQEAQAQKESAILQAQGEIARFNLLLPQYQAAPETTRQRLYLETLQAIYANNAKVFVDVDGGNNMLYLPLDQIMQNRQRQVAPILPLEGVGSQTGTSSNTPRVNSSGSGIVQPESMRGSNPRGTSGRGGN